MLIAAVGGSCLQSSAYWHYSYGAQVYQGRSEEIIEVNGLRFLKL